MANIVTAQPVWETPDHRPFRVRLPQDVLDQADRISDVGQRAAYLRRVADVQREEIEENERTERMIEIRARRFPHREMDDYRAGWKSGMSVSGEMSGNEPVYWRVGFVAGRENRHRRTLFMLGGGQANGPAYS